MISEDALADLLLSSGLHAKRRVAAPGEWDGFLATPPYVPVMYASEMIAYQHAYLVAEQIEDLSLVLLSDGRAVGVWPLTLTRVDGSTTLTSQGVPVLPPLLAPHLSEKTAKGIVKACLAFADGLALQNGISAWAAQAPFQGDLVPGLGVWHQQLMARGAGVRLSHDLLVDLSLDLEAIRLRFRKSYKPLLSVAARTWNVQILRDANTVVWAEFRALHQTAAGRQTRSDATWDLQYSALGRQEAFLVCLRDENDVMVGAGYFATGRTEGVYSVAAYDRSLFDKPLGHLVQYHAIQEMKALGLRWYRIGRRVFPGDKPAPTQKELSISEFKQGFATHLFPLFEYRLKIESGGAQSEY